MTISSRTPEGLPNHCDVCGLEVCLEPSLPSGDAPCSHCGHLLWWFHQRFDADAPIVQSAVETDWLERRMSELVEGGDSLDVVELVMEIEEKFNVSIPDRDYEKLKTVRDVIRYLARRRQPPSAGA